ncbi:hypothetical protein CVT26_005299 [Gymnopilus dilepis]|uniref:Uncharacterized protein n=1 Tax=Gymnopilus dilepis TaxID=231916 RepID=A0A409YSX3_9AGAR|nr:hypothetical protein CVT26_005299 [Gymnopilus dilepis]
MEAQSTSSTLPQGTFSPRYVTDVVQAIHEGHGHLRRYRLVACLHGLFGKVVHALDIVFFSRNMMLSSGPFDGCPFTTTMCDDSVISLNLEAEMARHRTPFNCQRPTSSTTDFSYQVITKTRMVNDETRAVFTHQYTILSYCSLGGCKLYKLDRELLDDLFNPVDNESIGRDLPDWVRPTGVILINEYSADGQYNAVTVMASSRNKANGLDLLVYHS